ncbi:MAG: Fur family transcriptional regulator [Pseudomonadota bacterium]
MADPLTRNQQLVLDALSSAERPQTAYALLDRVRADGIKAPPQVYRALEKLVAEGLAHRIESLNAFVACCHGHGHCAGTVVFMICDDCGHVDEFVDAALSQRIKELSLEQNFQPNKETLEIRGSCAACSA